MEGIVLLGIGNKFLPLGSSVLEGGWRGNLVMEFANHTNLPIRLYANSGAAQILFFEGKEPEVSYAEGSLKYQDQRGITLAKSK